MCTLNPGTVHHAKPLASQKGTNGHTKSFGKEILGAATVKVQDQQPSTPTYISPNLWRTTCTHIHTESNFCIDLHILPLNLSSTPAQWVPATRST